MLKPLWDSPCLQFMFWGSGFFRHCPVLESGSSCHLFWVLFVYERLGYILITSSRMKVLLLYSLAQLVPFGCSHTNEVSNARASFQVSSYPSLASLASTSDLCLRLFFPFKEQSASHGVLICCCCLLLACLIDLI